jgi:hypothetical protein
MHAPASSAPLSKAGHNSDSASCWSNGLPILRVRALPVEVQRLADKQYELFREDPFHPSLHLKQVGEVWTVRIGRTHRAIGYRERDIFLWGWIGSHEKYDKLLRRMK